MMAKDPTWTEQLGNAVLVQRGDVMDAVQRLCEQARKYGHRYRRTGTATSSKPTAMWKFSPGQSSIHLCARSTTDVVFGPPARGTLRWRSDPVGAGGDHHRGILPFWMGASVFSVGRAHHLYRSHAVESCLGESRLLRSFVRASMGLARRASRRSASWPPPQIDCPLSAIRSLLPVRCARLRPSMLVPLLRSLTDLAQSSLRHTDRKEQTIMLCRSTRDSRGEWSRTFASVRAMGFRPAAPPA